MPKLRNSEMKDPEVSNVTERWYDPDGLADSVPATQVPSSDDGSDSVGLPHAIVNTNGKTDEQRRKNCMMLTLLVK